jgi:hypothetical protein
MMSEPAAAPAPSWSPMGGSMSGGSDENH